MTGSTARAAAPGPQVVVMGVSASGKSSVAHALALQLGARYVDADDLHPPANVELMARGVPLTDDDRWPWLERVGLELAAASTGGIVVACSALRRAYRDRLREAAPRASFLHLTGSRELLQERARGRRNHFMPAALLDSQLDTLEALDADENGTEIDIDTAVDAIVLAGSTWLAGAVHVGDETGVA